MCQRRSAHGPARGPSALARVPARPQGPWTRVQPSQPPGNGARSLPQRSSRTAASGGRADPRPHQPRACALAIVHLKGPQTRGSRPRPAGARPGAPDQPVRRPRPPQGTPGAGDVSNEPSFTRQPRAIGRARSQAALPSRAVAHGRATTLLQTVTDSHIHTNLQRALVSGVRSPCLRAAPNGRNWSTEPSHRRAYFRGK